MTDPQTRAKDLVTAYVNEHLDKSDPSPDFSVYVVWFAYTLGSWKVLISTTLPDAMYYEVTYNGAKKETYLDAYKKFKNLCIQDGSVD
jgi:hypothetical protein